MKPERIIALVGLGSLLIFLPFGIAGQQIALAMGTTGLLLHGETRARLILTREAAKKYRATILGIAAWISVSLVALLISDPIPEGARELRKLTLLLALLLPIAAIRNKRERRIAVSLLLLSGAVAAAIGLIEHFRGAGFHPERLDGPINFYMTTSGVFLILSLFSLALLAEKEYLKGLAPAAFILITSALLLTYTRGAWFAWAAGAALLLWRVRRLLLLPCFLVPIVLLVALPAFRERLVTSWDIDYCLNRERILLWEAGWRAFLDHPVFGVGLHDLRGLIDVYRRPEASETLSHFHSNPIQIAVSMGAAGLAAFAAMIAGLYRLIHGNAGMENHGFSRALTGGAAAALTAFLVHGLFEWNMGDSEVLTTLYAVIGLASVSQTGSPVKNFPRVEKTS